MAEKRIPERPERLYDKLKLADRDGNAFEIPVEGCLGLLALGDLGLIAWRERKVDFIQSLREKEPKEEQDN